MTGAKRTRGGLRSHLRARTGRRHHLPCALQRQTLGRPHAGRAEFDAHTSFTERSIVPETSAILKRAIAGRKLENNPIISRPFIHEGDYRGSDVRLSLRRQSGCIGAPLLTAGQTVDRAASTADRPALSPMAARERKPLITRGFKHKSPPVNHDSWRLGTALRHYRAPFRLDFFFFCASQPNANLSCGELHTAAPPRDRPTTDSH